MQIKSIYGDGNVVTCDNMPSLAIGTHGQGQVTCRYQHLVETFGEPDEGDNFKTMADWTVLTPDGIATIYDWKQGDCYHGKGNGTAVEDVTEWNVGGPNPKVIEWIERAIAKNLMKLYATITSERATKGQGGNQFLDIVIRNEKEEEMMKVQVKGREKEKPCVEISYDSDKLSFLPQPLDIKGKKQKGEVDAAAQNCIYDHDHAQEPEKCEWHD